MIWLTWRQFRTQARVAAAALAAIAVYLVYLGSRIRDDYKGVLGCRPSDCGTTRHNFDESYTGPLMIAGLLLLAAPALIGMFWGAPLITREVEERTDRLVWNQSLTRTRWLVTKLVVLALVSAAVTGLFSLLLTWNATRYDQFIGNRFGALNFASRNVVPLGYAVFAFVLGTVIGLVVRRTLVAMALTLAVFAVVQLLVPTLVREHLMTPVTATVAFDEVTPSRSDLLAVNDRGATIIGYTMAGTWSLTDEAKVLNADGTPYTSQQATACDKSSPTGGVACMARQNLHFSYTYQPADRYWPFQWIELCMYLAVTLLLAAFGLWWIRRRSG
ncbi:ABC transporter permease subunit [Actinoplanes regularis]|uniref:ABC-2 family transporter protein n=1 Tax=Actinoplanes regularis TaxID=52697 RepID=A0A238YAQ9_9ACTN|nr:ABC transporter permease subunit [Actinoplanes regularis]GIE86074.1 transporter [Actinoplanes regularis]SNR67703.1 ABC-2 family transporter protein [Actinoplanes regularis]